MTTLRIITHSVKSIVVDGLTVVIEIVQLPLHLLSHLSSLMLNQLYRWMDKLQDN